MSDLPYWLALHRAPGIGAQLFAALLDTRTPRELFENPDAATAVSGLSAETLAWLRAPDWAAVERDLAWLAQPHNHVLTRHDPRYPPLLREIAGAPPLLFIHGDPAVLRQPQLAIVGSRHATATGLETAHEFAKHLSNSGLVITSGLALGIDGASHRGALAGAGLTVAVIGTGPDRVYPARHKGLAHDIAAAGGAIVSEFPPGTPALADHFPRRNRIISGLSLGVLVVEAAKQSGSLITARLAGDQGREVFAIPGSIHNPLARGCHALLKQGAKLVEGAEDVVEELGPLVQLTVSTVSSVEKTQAPAVASQASEELDSDYKRVLQCLGYEPTPVDLVIERSGLTTAVVSSMLLVLELHGYITSAPGGVYSRVLTRVIQ